jgi:hypothetical protein
MFDTIFTTFLDVHGFTTKDLSPRRIKQYYRWCIRVGIPAFIDSGLDTQPSVDTLRRMIMRGDYRN